LTDASGESIVVHSVQEEYFYLMVHRCSCGGPWLGEAQELEEDGPQLRHRVSGKCFKCAARKEFTFNLSRAGPRPTAPSVIRQISASAEPSRAVDAVEWADLARFYLERIARLKKPIEKAQSLLDARQCTEEALKFFGPADAAPPPAAVWSDSSRRKLSKDPDSYSRARLQAMVDRMPSIEELRQVDALDQKVFDKAVKEEAKKRVGRWWQVWKRFRREA
jgi:hypothetical protein